MTQIKRRQMIQAAALTGAAGILLEIGKGAGDAMPSHAEVVAFLKAQA